MHLVFVNYFVQLEKHDIVGSEMVSVLTFIDVIVENVKQEQRYLKCLSTISLDWLFCLLYVIFKLKNVCALPYFELIEVMQL